MVGIKPSMGLTSIPLSLVIPLTSYQDTVGPLARTVYDTAVVLSIIAGVDQYDNYISAISNGGKISDYVAAATKYTNLTGSRIGVPRNSFGDDLLYGDANKTLAFNVSAFLIPTEYASSWISAQGLPAVIVPLGGYADDIPIIPGLRELVAVAPGIPFGLSFTGPKWVEETFIAIAAAFEKASIFRKSYVMGPNSTIPHFEIVGAVNNRTTVSNTTSTTSTTPTTTAK